MKIFVYNHNVEDETVYFDKFGKELGVEWAGTQEAPSLENAALAEGYECVSIATTPILEPLIKKWSELGVSTISARTVGYDNIDLTAAQKYGMHVGNASYPPDSVAEYTVTLMLMVLRRLKVILGKTAIGNFSPKGNKGKNLGSMKVGVMGTGHIGYTVIKKLSGFGCELLAYDPYENEAVKEYARYVEMDTLLRESDLITLHMPLSEKDRHIIGKEAIAKMKEGSFLINTGRGGLVDTDALIEALTSGKLAGAGLDVLENESGIFYQDYTGRPVPNHQITLLAGMPQVVLTPHMAYYTETSVEHMVKSSVEFCVSPKEKGQNPFLIV